MSDTDTISYGKEVPCTSVRSEKKKEYMKIYAFSFFDHGPTSVFIILRK